MGQVLLVRHGQASFGAADYDVLSEIGQEQSHVLGQALAERGIRPDAIVRGGMRRHRETAEQMIAGAGWDVGEDVDVEVDEDWDEFDHEHVIAAVEREHRDLDRSAFQELFERATGRWSSGLHDVDYVETWPHFTARVAAALDRVLLRDERTLVVVTSGGTIGLVASHLLCGDASLWPRLNKVCINTGVTKIVRGGGGGTNLVSYNSHAHLEHDRRLLTYR